MTKEEIYKIVNSEIKELEKDEKKYREELYNPLDGIRELLRRTEKKKKQLTAFLQYFDPEQIKKTWGLSYESREEDALTYFLPGQTEVMIVLSNGSVHITQAGRDKEKMCVRIFGINEIKYEEDLKRVVFVRRGENEVFAGINSDGCCNIAVGS
jgi:hypothetical protein